MSVRELPSRAFALGRSPRSSLRGLVAVLLVVAAVQFLVLEAITAAQWRHPAYSYVFNDISDLGVPERGVIFGRLVDSPAHVLMNVAFVAIGVVSLAALLIGSRVLSRGPRVAVRILALLQSAGIVCVGVFHGGPAARADGTLVWHLLGALAAVLGGNTTLIVVGSVALRRRWSRWYGVTSVLLGVVGWLSYGSYLLVIPSWPRPPRGLFERGCVYTILAWMLITGLALLRHPGPAPALANEGGPADAIGSGAAPPSSSFRQAAK